MVTYIDRSWALADQKYYDQRRILYLTNLGKSGEGRNKYNLLPEYETVSAGFRSIRRSLWNLLLVFLFIDCWMIIRWPTKIIDKNLLFLEVYECLMQYKQSPWMRFSRPFLLGNISNIPFFPVGHKLLLPQYVLECSSICGKARDRSQKKVVVFTLRGGSFLSDFSGIGLDGFLCWRLRTLAVCIIRLAAKFKRPFEAAGEGCRENPKKSFFQITDTEDSPPPFGLMKSF